ncbi:MAG TPA: hypothetical protein VF457_19115, partial [Burkholderiaceae bacterium]
MNVAFAMLCNRSLRAAGARPAGLAACLLAGVLAAPAHAADSAVYYVCPGNVFTNTISPKEAEARGCK